MSNTLISAAQLAEHLDDPQWVVLDCRFDLTDKEAGREFYEQGHIPGAQYIHLEDDLSGPRGARTGRHPLPEPSDLAARLAAAGVGADTQVVAYDDAHGAFAARLWWMLRWLGHDKVAVLDGDIAAWYRGGYPVETRPRQPRPGSLAANPCHHMVVDAAFVGGMGEEGGLLVDARGPARFVGDEEPFDAVAGHVPGAINMPLRDNLTPAATFIPAEELRQRFLAVLGATSPEAVVHMCGSGVTACHNLLAMEIAGLNGSRLYPGSWSEWITDPGRPVARGA